MLLANRRYITIFVAVGHIICAGCSGCSPKPPDVIVGRVIAASNYFGSIVEGGSVEKNPQAPSLKGSASSLEGATIRLAFDEKGVEPVQGVSTESNADGYYSLDVHQVPPLQDDRRCYYLIVEKDGYVTAHQEFRIGFMNVYYRNTVFMAPEKKGNAPK